MITELLFCFCFVFVVVVVVVVVGCLMEGGMHRATGLYGLC